MGKGKNKRHRNQVRKAAARMAKIHRKALEDLADGAAADAARKDIEEHGTVLKPVPGLFHLEV